jgi:hypothetical protein
MMLNSCIFIFGFLLVCAAIYGSLYLSRMIACISWRTVHTNLAPISIGMGTIETTPMALFPPIPSFGFSVPDSRFNLLVGVSRPTAHSTTSNLLIR